MCALARNDMVFRQSRLLLEEKLSPQVTDVVQAVKQPYRYKLPLCGTTTSDLADARPPSPQGEGIVAFGVENIFRLTI